MENKIGDEIEFKHLLSAKSFKGKIVDEYEGSNWIVDCGGKDKMVVVRKNDKTIKSLKESKIDKLVSFMLKESATATPAKTYTYKNFYIASPSLGERIGLVKRPARMPKPAGWQATALPSGLKPIDYGHCEGIFVDKYGKLRGEKMYEDLFINGSNNIGWSIAKGILQEKVAMLKALDIQIPVAKYDSLSYWLIYKVYMKEKFPQIAQKLGFK